MKKPAINMLTLAQVVLVLALAGAVGGILAGLGREMNQLQGVQKCYECGHIEEGVGPWLGEKQAFLLVHLLLGSSARAFGGAKTQPSVGFCYLVLLPKNKQTLVCSICWFPWYEYSHHN